MSITHKFVYRHMSSVRATLLLCAYLTSSAALPTLSWWACALAFDNCRNRISISICCPIPGIVLNFKIFTPQFCLLISAKCCCYCSYCCCVVVVVVPLFVISFNVVRQHFGDCFRLFGIFFLRPPLSVVCLLFVVVVVF